MDCIFEFDDVLGIASNEPLAPSPPPPNEIIVGDFGYACENLLGHGAFAVVYKGRRVADSKPAAVKVISKKNASLSRIEISILEELTGLEHPNIVALFGFQDTEDKFYLFMEYCNQMNLHDYIRKQGTLCEDTIKFYLRQIAEAMQILNNKGIIHRDIKPQNILLHSDEKDPVSAEMVVKLADFGLARFIGEGVMCATMCGTSIYMAPEVLLSQSYDQKVDLWSIGAIAYQCFTGVPPVICENEMKLVEFYKRHELCIVDRPIGSSNDFWTLMFGLLQPLPDRRFTFQEFYDHPYIRNTPCLPTPRSMGSYHSIASFSPSPPDGQAAASEVIDEVRPESVGSPLFPIDIPMPPRTGRPEVPKEPKEPKEVDREEDGFVLIPREGPSPSPRSIESYYDEVHEVVLPRIRKKKKSDNSEQDKRS